MKMDVWGKSGGATNGFVLEIPRQAFGEGWGSGRFFYDKVLEGTLEMLYERVRYHARGASLLYLTDLHKFQKYLIGHSLFYTSATILG